MTYHRGEVRLRVPRTGPVLPARPGRVPPGAPALGHRDLDAQDPRRETPVHRQHDGRQIQDGHRQPLGKRTCFQVVPRDQGRKPLVAQFGGIPLTRQRAAVLSDLSPVMASAKRNELIHRLVAGSCEICESRTGIEVHHIRKLADLNRPDKPAWVYLMAKRRRRPSWSVAPTTKTSTQAGPTHPPGTDHRRAACCESDPRGSGRGRRKRT